MRGDVISHIKKNKSIKIVIFVIILFQAYYAFASENQVIITLNSGLELIGSINRIESWGIILENNQSVNFKLINKIITSEKTVADKLKQGIAEIQYVKEGDLYVFDFQSQFTGREIAKIKDNKVIKRSSITALIMTNRAENFEIQFSFEPKHISYLIGQIAYSFGSTIDDKSIKNIETQEIISKTNYNFSHQSFSLGMGLSTNYDEYMMAFLLNYAFKSLTTKTTVDGIVSNEKNKLAQDSYFLSVFFQQFFENSKIFWSVGARYYFQNIELINKTNRFGFNIGFGLEL
jgi:hypothetical protein